MCRAVARALSFKLPRDPHFLPEATAGLRPDLTPRKPEPCLSGWRNAPCRQRSHCEGSALGASQEFARQKKVKNGATLRSSRSTDGLLTADRAQQTNS